MSKANFNLKSGLMALLLSAALSDVAIARTVTNSIANFGAIGDGQTLNTSNIQSAIDQSAAKGGGTVVVPKGVFLTGALFLKPGVNLHLDKDAVLKASTDMKNFPEQRVRIEGHFEEHFNPALINAAGCDGLRIDGEGTLDGAGRPIWDQFWKLRRASKDPRNFKNVSVPRAQMCAINNSKNVVIDGITFKDSQFWNLHLYNCQNATVTNARFEVPDDYRQAPSTDGIDVDSCRDITVEDCFFSVTDDCIALKGSKGPEALKDKDSPPVEHIRISHCTFKRGGGVTLGSEATIVRDVVVENCRFTGPMSVLNFKLRPDTPQHYENIHYRNITVDSDGGKLVNMFPWTQYFDLKGQPAPKSSVRDITMENVKGRYGSFGTIQGNPGQTEIGNITLENIDVQLTNTALDAEDVKHLEIKNVRINGKPFSRKLAKQ
ncbi:MAG TPA: glycosyl hydrolase family 28 protein [Verrucomicrobiae bacterium]|nr:glycosyl hydrolase family 28 protein [Verrucomicrobiae bacterium]